MNKMQAFHQFLRQLDIVDEKKIESEVDWVTTLPKFVFQKNSSGKKGLVFHERRYSALFNIESVPNEISTGWLEKKIALHLKTNDPHRLDKKENPAFYALDNPAVMITPLILDDFGVDLEIRVEFFEIEVGIEDVSGEYEFEGKTYRDADISLQEEQFEEEYIYLK